MPRPFSFAAAFFPTLGDRSASTTATNSTNSKPRNNSESSDSPKIACTPLNIKLPPIPSIPLKRDSASQRDAQCAVVLGKGACTCGSPEELIVLAHGLQGDLADFSYLLDEIDASGPARAGRALVHASSVNTDRTHDGVMAGGERLAYDIRAVVASHSSLRRVSLVGFSLGALYIRYAAAALFDPETNTIAGLEPACFIAVAGPHLGVRNFGVYRFLPNAVTSRAHLLIGDTGRELFLEDGANNILVRMTTDETDGTLGSVTNARPLKFISSLKAFQRRYLYANTRSDFMVNYGTAVMNENISELSISDTVAAQPETAVDYVDIDRSHDDKGCKICFTLRYPEVDHRDAAMVLPEPGEEEKVMAKRLRDVGWQVVAVEFPTTLPIAHNRMIAMSRNPIHSWMNQAGRRVVHHLVDTLMDAFPDAHQPTFQKVDTPPQPKRNLSLRRL